ncbi:hypothetical protein NLJ89_g559 [Agrocybe chaxingu]|uniref:Cytochrome P450 n=1 Tax=Agrocybe chaxingu TaxID=84603 RepID=A0A9W8N1P5_9AGAR|nr:hypothetical protein NLJ89_g559 [Agrocybe chaxingu]
MFSTMLLLMLEGIFLYAVSWVLWRRYRESFVKSPLDNIPGPIPKSFWKGVFPDVFNVHGWDFHHEITQKYGSVIKIKALFGENQLYVFDPKAMHHIVIKIDLLSWMTRTALESVGQAGLGYSFDDLTEDVILHPYSESAKQLMCVDSEALIPAELPADRSISPSPLSFSMIFPRMYLSSVIVRLGPPKFRRFLVDIIPWKTMHRLRDVVDVLHNTSVEIFESKKKALEEGDEAVNAQLSQGNDILSTLMRANMDASKEDKLADNEVLGQMSTLTFAATDTTSSALARILDLLSKNQDIQDKLRNELREARLGLHSGVLPYDELVSLPYLDAICRETLRLYPPISVINRTTREAVVLPLSKPILGLDGRDISEIPIPKNTNIIVGIMASNRNPEIWGPDAYEWKPERWLQPLPESVAAAHIPGIYSNLMTFLGGGRACIGSKFSQLEMKVVLSVLLESFKFSPSKNAEIYWQMNNIATPTVANSGTNKPQLPLIVERVQ